MRILGIDLNNATVPIVLANIVMYVLQQVLGGWFTALFINMRLDIIMRPWTLLTSMFLHGSPMHLIFNMYVLIVFGAILEQRIGTKRFLLVYFLSGILASAIGGLFYTASLGASGAIMGVIGIMIILLPDIQILFFYVVPMSLRTAGILFAFIDILGVFGVGRPGIGNIAHLVGLGVGLTNGLYLKSKKTKLDKKMIAKSDEINTKKHKNNEKKNKNHMDDDEIDEYIKYGRL